MWLCASTCSSTTFFYFHTAHWQLNADWCWLVLIDSDRSWLILIYADWFWLMLIDAGWCWLMLIDWLILIGGIYQNPLRWKMTWLCLHLTHLKGKWCSKTRHFQFLLSRLPLPHLNSIEEGRVCLTDYSIWADPLFLKTSMRILRMIMTIWLEWSLQKRMMTMILSRQG